MFEPIIITAYLRCGVVSSDPWLPLDGTLLFRAMVREYGCWPEAELPGEGLYESMGRPLPSLPLAEVQQPAPFDYYEEQEGRPFRYYKISFAEWGQPYGEGRDYWHKINDDGLFLDLLSPRVKRIFELGGRYKTYHMPIYYRVAPWVRWHALGDARGIRELLAGQAWLGKKKASGWGAVTRWDIAQTNEDRSVWWQGVPQRAIPVASIPKAQVRDANQIYYAYRPPYYGAGNQILCYMPRRVRLAK